MIYARSHGIAVRLILVLFLLGAPLSASLAIQIPEVTGVVQQWAPQYDHVVIGGVRYRVNAETMLLDEKGQLLSASQVGKGSRVRMIENNGTAVSITVVTGGR